MVAEEEEDRNCDGKKVQRDLVKAVINGRHWVINGRHWVINGRHWVIHGRHWVINGRHWVINGRHWVINCRHWGKVWKKVAVTAMLRHQIRRACHLIKKKIKSAIKWWVHCKKLNTVSDVITELFSYVIMGQKRPQLPNPPGP